MTALQREGRADSARNMDSDTIGSLTMALVFLPNVKLNRRQGNR